MADAAVMQQLVPTRKLRVAVCVPKGKPAALDYVNAFIEEAKTSGLVRSALDEMGLKSSLVTPDGMKD